MGEFETSWTAAVTSVFQPEGQGRRGCVPSLITATGILLSSPQSCDAPQLQRILGNTMGGRVLCYTLGLLVSTGGESG